jgi:hypothetical protein
MNNQDKINSLAFFFLARKPILFLALIYSRQQCSPPNEKEIEKHIYSVKQFASEKCTDMKFGNITNIPDVVQCNRRI